jgi:hypothetical protein
VATGGRRCFAPETAAKHAIRDGRASGIFEGTCSGVESKTACVFLKIVISCAFGVDLLSRRRACQPSSPEPDEPHAFSDRYIPTMSKKNRSIKDFFKTAPPKPSIPASTTSNPDTVAGAVGQYSNTKPQRITTLTVAGAQTPPNEGSYSPHLAVVPRSMHRPVRPLRPHPPAVPQCPSLVKTPA